MDQLVLISCTQINRMEKSNQKLLAQILIFQKQIHNKINKIDWKPSTVDKDSC